jgi:hypothetical protein
MLSPLEYGTKARLPRDGQSPKDAPEDGFGIEPGDRRHQGVGPIGGALLSRGMLSSSKGGNAGGRTPAALPRLRPDRATVSRPNAGGGAGRVIPTGGLYAGRRHERGARRGGATNGRGAAA